MGEPSVREVLSEELRCPVKAVEAVLEAVEFYVGEAKVYQYIGPTPLVTIVVVIPRGGRRSWVSYAIAKHAELKGIDLYSLIDLVVLKEDELARLFPYGRGRLKELRNPDDLEC